MRKRTTPGLALMLALALAVPAAGWAATLKVAPPELKVSEHRLANGLTVLLHEDHSVPVVSVHVWYHVGSKDERKGRSGFAHLFEHLMFKGSANVGPEEHPDFIASIGGRLDATTNFDRTLYFEIIPSNYLERVLWMEADRMWSLDVSEKNFLSERDVVKEERRLRIDNPPFGRLFEVVLKTTFTTHPYGILPIGSMADLDAATIEDVREFHRIYYVPNNATLILAGDFDSAQALRWIEKHFGAIPKGKDIPRSIPAEPAQTAERRAVEYDSKAPLPAVLFTYHVPEEGHPDLYALEVASNILSDGQSSRLYRKMVYDRQIAIEASGEALVLEDPGVFYFFLILQQGQKPEEGEKAIEEEVARILNEPVSAAELEKAKNQLLAERVFARQTVDAKANIIGHAKVILDDLSRVNSEYLRYQKVTAADVQAAAKKYFRPENRSVIYMLPEAMRPAAQGESKSGKGEVK
ncbi:MAG TPA: pitrilysin family protein [Thermoanaerobaculia bacterium]